MKKLLSLTAIFAVALLVGCSSQSTDAQRSSFSLYVSDRPADIATFDRVNVTFSEARIFSANNTTVTIPVGDRPPIDLKEVQGEERVKLVNTTLPTGNYSKIELEVETVDAARDGSSVDVKVPPGKLQLTKPFTVRPGREASFVFDIQLVLRGNANNNQGYILQPNIGDSGEI